MATLIYDSNSELLYLEISDREKGKNINPWIMCSHCYESYLGDI